MLDSAAFKFETLVCDTLAMRIVVDNDNIEVPTFGFRGVTYVSMRVVNAYAKDKSMLHNKIVSVPGHGPAITARVFTKWITRPAAVIRSRIANMLTDRRLKWSHSIRVGSEMYIRALYHNRQLYVSCIDVCGLLGDKVYLYTSIDGVEIKYCVANVSRASNKAKLLTYETAKYLLTTFKCNDKAKSTNWLIKNYNTRGERYRRSGLHELSLHRIDLVGQRSLREADVVAVKKQDKHSISVDRYAATAQRQASARQSAIESRRSAIAKEAPAAQQPVEVVDNGWKPIPIFEPEWTSLRMALYCMPKPVQTDLSAFEEWIASME